MYTFHIYIYINVDKNDRNILFYFVEFKYPQIK